jgi:hypothetical protein
MGSAYGKEALSVTRKARMSEVQGRLSSEEGPAGLDILN